MIFYQSELQDFTLLQGDCSHILPTIDDKSINMIFADPPYGQGLGEKALLSALEGNWLNSDAIIILEEEADALLDLDERFVIEDERDYGLTTIRLIRLAQ